MDSSHSNNKRGMRERIFETVVSDLSSAIAHWNMACTDDLTFVEELEHATVKLRYLANPGAISDALEHAEIALIQTVLEEQSPKEAQGCADSQGGN